MKWPSIENVWNYLHLHKLYAPWPWNVSVPPFPETWKDRNILRDPSAFTLEKLQQEVSTNLTVGNEWRVSNSKTRNRTTALHGDDHVETSNRFAALQALEDQEILDLPNPSLEYKKGDVILAMGNGASLVHCIGEDVTMGKGIAAQIEKKFSCKEKIKNQRKSVGEIAVVETPTTSPQNTQRPQREDTMLHRVNHAVSRQPHGDVNSGTQPSGSKPTSPTSHNEVRLVHYYVNPNLAHKKCGLDLIISSALHSSLHNRREGTLTIPNLGGCMLEASGAREHGRVGLRAVKREICSPVSVYSGKRAKLSCIDYHAQTGPPHRTNLSLLVHQ
ncbi:hypothetical protein B566_EDAN011350 [Ephemera danica]|nr:hypothetical protein B566_EDAN011350 [Ephemera danica]